MTLESPRADLVFSYVRRADGTYRGKLCVHAPPGTPPGVLWTEETVDGVSRERWVQFVLEMICGYDGGACPTVIFEFPRPDGAPHRHQLDRRTVEQIRVRSLSVEDLLL